MIPRVYCKYCYRFTRLIPGDGVYECEHCGAGLAPFEEIKVHGSYKRFQECMVASFAVMNEAYKWHKERGETVDEMSLYPKCPHHDRKTRGLYGMDLILVMRKTLGLPDLPDISKTEPVV
jgi:hypothetical protein